MVDFKRDEVHASLGRVFNIVENATKLTTNKETFTQEEAEATLQALIGVHNALETLEASGDWDKAAKEEDHD